MTEAVARRIITAKAQVKSQNNPYAICGEQRGTEVNSSPSISVFPCRYNFTNSCCIHSFIHRYSMLEIGIAVKQHI
jgi:hypothetical protein